MAGVVALALMPAAARELPVWALDSMSYENDDPRLASKSTEAQRGAVRAAREAIGSCSRFSDSQAAAWREMTALANQGLVEAQTNLAFFGMLCPVAVPDRSEPMRWAGKAAATGYVPALEILAQLHEWPRIPNQSPEKGFDAYRAAAEKGSAASMVWTRVALCLGKGTPVDKAAAAAWGERAKAWYRANGRAVEADKMKTSC